MKKLIPTGLNVCEERTIVVLTQEKIVWYLVPIEGDPIHISTENSSNGNVKIPERFRLSGNTRQVIELVVDSPIDDLDRAKVLEKTSRKFEVFSVFRALWKLKREYTEAAIIKLPKPYFPNIASILHSSLPEDTQRIIESIQNQGLLISHMTTSTQLMSRTVIAKEPCLLVVPCGSYQQRLMLIDAGVVVFMRIVNVVSEEGVKNDKNYEKHLEDSVDYLVNVGLLKNREVRIQLANITNRETLSDNRLEDYFTDTYLLGVAKLISHESGSGRPANQEEDVNKQDVGAKETRNRTSARGRQFYLNLKRLIITKQTDGGFKPYPVTHGLLKHHGVLSPSRKLFQSYRSLLLLRRVTIVLAVVTFISVLVASIYSVRQIRQLNWLEEERGRVEAKILQFRTELEERHDDPFLSAATLKRNKAFSEKLKGSPQSVLTLVASLIREFPSLQLQSLSWSILPGDSDEETIVSSTVHAARRESFILTHSNQEKLSITVGGSFDAISSLRDRQQQLEMFSRSLSASELIGRISILGSPVESAGSSDLPSGYDDNFRVRFWAGLP
ncbi:MAG: hypothetical protein AB8B84_06515 [Granulosicoccus sp.]